jgi:hypothetical protein
MYGISGQQHVIHSGFPHNVTVASGQWGNVGFAIPLTGTPCDHPDHSKANWDCGTDIRHLVLRSMQNGWPLHCCLQDDSDVANAVITVNYLP